MDGNLINMMSFLLGNGLVIRGDGKTLSADTADDIRGDFYVYDPQLGEEIYRGKDFGEAVRKLTGSDLVN